MKIVFFISTKVTKSILLTHIYDHSFSWLGKNTSKLRWIKLILLAQNTLLSELMRPDENKMNRGYGVWCHFQQYFSYIVGVSFIDGATVTLSELILFRLKKGDIFIVCVYIFGFLDQNITIITSVVSCFTKHDI